VTLWLSDNGTNQANQQTSSANLTANQWIHIVAVYNQSSANVVFYINGVVSADNGNSIYSSIYNSSTHLDIGRKQDSSPEYFPGSLDDVRIYNRALTQAEITQLYNLGR